MLGADNNRVDRTSRDAERKTQPGLLEAARGYPRHHPAGVFVAALRGRSHQTSGRSAVPVLVGLTIASSFAMLRVPRCRSADLGYVSASRVVLDLRWRHHGGLDGLVLSARMLSTSRSIDRILFNTADRWCRSGSRPGVFALGGNRRSRTLSRGGCWPCLAVWRARLPLNGHHRRAVSFDAGSRLIIWRALVGSLDTCFGGPSARCS